MKKIIALIGATILAAGLYYIGSYNYLFFHSLAEGFSIFVACTIFIVAWNCRRYFDNRYFLFVGIAYLFVGILDLVHTFSYSGMNLMPGYDANAPTQLWIAARYVESLTLLLAPLMIKKRVRSDVIFTGYALVVTFLLLSILHWRIFPDCFLENAGGLTVFKKTSEYIIMAILMAAGAILLYLREHFESHVLRWLLLSIIFTVFSELSFTTYASVYDFSNMLGHFFKIISFYFIYKSVIETGLTKPYDLLFRDLDRQRDWLQVTLGSIGDAVICIDVNRRITFINPVASALTGWQINEAMGQPVGDVFRTISEQSHESVENIAECVLRQECALRMADNTSLINRDGREIPIEDSAAPTKDKDGKIIGAVVVFHDVSEKRDRDKKLRQRELLYRELVQNANSAIIRWKCDGTISFFNEYAQALFGYTADEVIGKSVDILLPEVESSGADLTGLINDIVDRPEAYIHNINENICRDGRRIWMNWTNKPIYDESGNLTEILAVGSDYTQIKAAEEALVKSEQMHRSLANELELERAKLETAISSMPVGFGIGDTQGTTLSMNRAGLRLHGFESDLEMGHALEDYRSAFELKYPDGRSMPPDQWPVARALRGEYVQDFELILRNKLKNTERICAYSVAPVPAEGNDIGLFVYTMQDITESKKAQQILQYNIEKFELLADVTARLIETEDPRNLVNALCREVMTFLDCQLFLNFLLEEDIGKLHLNAYAGVSAADIMETEWLDLINATVCGRVALEKQQVIAEDILNTPDPKTDLVRSYGIQAYCCHPLLIQDHLIGTLSFGTKTRKKFTAEEVEVMKTVANNVALAMQRIQVEETLRNINEELKQKVYQRTKELEDNYENLSLANAQLRIRAEQLRRLANELTMAEQKERKRLSKVLHDGLQQHLAAAKMRIGFFAENLTDPNRKHEAYDIEAILAESIEMSRSLSVELSPPVLQQSGIEYGLKWLVRWMRDKHNFNVELNMDDHIELPEDAKIIVFEAVRELLFNAAKHAKVSWAKVNVHQNSGPEVRIIISDEGVGFDTSLMNSMETDTGGLGLFSVRERLDSIGGGFEADSSPGKGSRFTLIVPLKMKADLDFSNSRADMVTSHGSGSQESPIRVLLADDHALFRDGIGRILNQEPDIEIVGYAKNGREAVELTRKLKPNLILMDIGMPGLDGIEATRIIHKEFDDTRIIGLSMHEDEGHSHDILKAGAVAYKNKGCAPAELVSTIRNCM